MLDVADCLDAVRFLIQAGEVDGRRLVISGASAGGFTALCALAFHDLFAAGTSAYGIADLEAFREQAPKFQAHELDRLVGPYPEVVLTYQARSPVRAADQITSPVLLLQGLEDTIVPPAQTRLMAEALNARASHIAISPSKARATGCVVPAASSGPLKRSCPCTWTP